MGSLKMEEWYTCICEEKMWKYKMSKKKCWSKKCE